MDNGFFLLAEKWPYHGCEKKKKTGLALPNLQKIHYDPPLWSPPPPSPLIKNVPSPIHDSGFNETLFYLVSNICLRE